jgi:glycosyltransferase involved in cell wall biosynthesis
MVKMKSQENADKVHHPQQVIAIVTCCLDDWGGSEELWARAIPFLLADGFRIKVFKAGLNRSHPEYLKLSSMGVELEELNTPPAVKESTGFRIKRKLARIINNDAYPDPPQGNIEKLKADLQALSPQLVVISQGINFDGVHYGMVCNQLGINYALVAQKGVDFYWPDPGLRKLMQEVYYKASKNFFIAQHNLRLTEDQIGSRLNNSSLIFNPVKIHREIIPYPAVEGRYKLACIGRYFLLDKGQDMLIRIMSREVWKNRNITVTFIGSGPDKDALQSLALLHGVDNVLFEGYATNMEDVWKNYHALILPSRSEGMPLVLLEAMSAGRTSIITNAGGNAEIVQNDVTGFIGEAQTESFNEAMERAWSKRDEWEEMGIKASTYIKEKIPMSPEKEFANQIKLIIHG